MSEVIHGFISIDLMPMLAGVLAAISCALLGNFLILRRQSLMGDAVSHAVLPGLAIAFIVTGSRAPIPMLIGAAIAGVLAVLLIEFVTRAGRVEPGAAMGVVFTVLFALGVVLIEHAARHVDLDADCVLQGQPEYLSWWGAPREWGAYLEWSTWRGTFDEGVGAHINGVPRQVVTLLVTTLAIVAFVSLLFKELRIASFDPALATAQGFNANTLHFVLMIVVAAAVVASFEAVGSILVIAMLICPGATARLLTDRLSTQLWLSAAIAIATGVLGYASGAWFAPHVFGDAVSTAGSITVVGGLLLLLAIAFSPSHGLLPRLLRRRSLADRILREDLLGALFRAGETGQERVSLESLRAVLESSLRRAVQSAQSRGLVLVEGSEVVLTDKGRAESSEIVRRHRLWETYLVSEAGIAPDHVHDSAQALEHVLDRREAPIVPQLDDALDPHGRRIPDPND